MSQTTLCLATFAVLCLGQNLPDGQVQGNCTGKLEMAIKCWTWHQKIPKCGEKSSLVKCPEIYLPQIRECDENIKIRVRSRMEIYARTDALLCGDKDLHKELEEDEYCWHAARSCAENIVNLESEVTTETCRMTQGNIDSCIASQAGRPNCQPLLKKYTSILLESTPCKATGAASIAQLSIFLAITTILPVIM